MSKHSYGGNGSLNQIFRQAAHADDLGLFARRNDYGYEGRHRRPDGWSDNIPYGAVIWSWSADAWIRRIKPEGKYPRNFTVVATAEEAAGLRRLK
ncbi:hypothetical protein SEA_ILEEKAY_45 [Mycobacterium phage ILeeKay]|nr:hypothetical protein SEA_ILEEKAY_45 [Mycobacterium phage ILeeKay]